MTWRQRAACKNVPDPDLFFPVGTEGPALRQIARAKTICRVCAVTAECLAWALETGQDDGVWGALAEDERRALRRRQLRLSPADQPTATGEVA